VTTAEGPVRAYHPSLFVCYIMYVPQLFVMMSMTEQRCSGHGHS
jgi:hypothetical protein